MATTYVVQRLDELIEKGMHLLTIYDKRGSIDQYDLWITEVQSFLNVNAPEYVQPLLAIAPKFIDRFLEEPYGRASYECYQQQIEVLKLAIAKLKSESERISLIEIEIHNSILELVPSAACAYKQALLDLADENRLSYRGVALELREALKDTLDHLAPDKAVLSQANFKYEKNLKKPTMKQKVLYILKPKCMPRNAVKAPEKAVQLIEDKVASLARTTYDRSSIAVHVASEREEVLHVKYYVNAIFCEILSLKA
jgi:hypothetical protein